MKIKKFHIILFLLVIIWFAMPVLADAQCAMCNATASTATESNKEGALSLNSGILFLMAIPYILLTTLVIIWWRYRKQKRNEQS